MHECFLRRWQKVVLEKSKFFISNNVNRGLLEFISRESSIKVTKKLGKYLGIPSSPKTINKDTFGGVLEQATWRLNRFKSKSLSFVGRIIFGTRQN